MSFSPTTLYALFFVLLSLTAAVQPAAPAQTTVPLPKREDIKPARADGEGWVRPAEEFPAEARWGIDGGIQFGIWARSPGPRGLISVYCPYLGFAPNRTVNFIAIEPMKDAVRFYSELERSGLDDEPGLRFWTVDRLEDAGAPRLPWEPARGEIVTVPDGKGGTVEALRVCIVTERYVGGMQVVVEVTVRKDRPRELRLRTFLPGEQAPVDAVVLTATMGNFMRLRELWLKEKMVSSLELFPEHRESSFTAHRRWGVEELFRTADGGVVVAATPDEEDLSKAVFAPGVHRHWQETKAPGTQYWRVESAEVRETLRAQVNGRFTYWASDAPIPGGVSFENFELVDGYREGQEVIFGISEVVVEESLAEEWERVGGVGF